MEKYGYGATMTVAEASALLHVDSPTVRYMIREMNVPWGTCIAKEGCERRKYIIYSQRLLDTLGIGGENA